MSNEQVFVLFLNRVAWKPTWSTGVHKGFSGAWGIAEGAASIAQGSRESSVFRDTKVTVKAEGRRNVHCKRARLQRAQWKVRVWFSGERSGGVGRTEEAESSDLRMRKLPRI